MFTSNASTIAATSPMIAPSFVPALVPSGTTLERSFVSTTSFVSDDAFFSATAGLVGGVVADFFREVLLDERLASVFLVGLSSLIPTSRRPRRAS